LSLLWNGPLPAQNAVSGKPHEKGAAETSKKGHLATTVFTGGNPKFCAHMVEGLSKENRNKGDDTITGIVVS
jgi:hypothetical protein